ncbi:hypothetical protein AB0B28_20025 [Glycomyces sp. NPDC046736]|uniref:hypothetical protein n=1 Tax=Glycomyces sp. NPDC046736 TaxID=3155615 RepID=UPI0033E5ABDB
MSDEEVYREDLAVAIEIAGHRLATSADRWMITDRDSGETEYYTTPIDVVQMKKIYLRYLA